MFPGWYADPEAAILDGQYWIYPTWSAAYGKQLFFDAFSSPDLVHRTKHSRVLDASAIAWAKKAMWAPAIVVKGGKYYFFFSANDIHSDNESGGIGVAVADRPGRPFHDLLGNPLIGAFHHGAQPIDQSVFQDTDGRHYIYGSWVTRTSPGGRAISPPSLRSAIGEGLGVPVHRLSEDEATAYFDFLARFVATDNPTSGALTRSSLGWRPEGPDLLTDMRDNGYFA